MKGELAAALFPGGLALPAPISTSPLPDPLVRRRFFSRTGALEERGPKRGVRRFRASLPGVYFQGDERLVAVVFIGRHRPMRAVPGLKHGDRDHQRGGKAGGVSGGILLGHGVGSCLLGGGGPSPAQQAPEVSDRICNHPRAFGSSESARAARPRSRPPPLAGESGLSVKETDQTKDSEWKRGMGL